MDTTPQQRDLARLIALIDRALGRTWPPPCLCGHDADQHSRGRGACRGPDSYGIRCTCPSVAPDYFADDPDDAG